MKTSLRRTQVVAVALVLAVLLGGFLWQRHRAAQQREQACRDAYAYTLWLDRQGYHGPVRDPTFQRNRDRCFG